MSFKYLHSQQDDGACRVCVCVELLRIRVYSVLALARVECLVYPRVPKINFTQKRKKIVDNIYTCTSFSFLPEGHTAYTEHTHTHTNEYILEKEIQSFDADLDAGWMVTLFNSRKCLLARVLLPPLALRV